MIKGNKGEWSEIYVLFKLLSDKQLNLGDQNIENLEGVFYPILNIIREEIEGNFVFSITDKIVLIKGGQKLVKVPLSLFKENSIILLNEIKSSSSSAFAVPKVEEFMKSINCISLKAKSTSKKDITVVIHDQITNQQPSLGFSIKSQLGSPSTLLNAGETTNFIFKISGSNLKDLNIKNINDIDSRSKIIDRLSVISQHDCKLIFHKTSRKIFSNNLILIDSKLPEILSHILYQFYTTKKSKLAELVSKVSLDNPLNFDVSDDHSFYKYKIKNFLVDIALGMTPSKVWSGTYDATGGYLVVKEDGKVLCYHIYNKNIFEDYLFNNTKLETASSSRHKFGTIYTEGNDLYIKLNLQIRFIK